MKRKPPVPRRDAGRPRGAPIAEAVLAATLEELATSGLENLSVERIAQRAEVNKTSIYRRWPTREDLVVAALEGVLENMTAQAPDTGSLRGDLLGLLWPVVALMGDPMGRALLRASISESVGSKIAALGARKLEEQAAHAVPLLVARAQARGEWSAGVRGEQLIFALVGAVIHRAMVEHVSITEPWLESLVDLLLFGVLPREAPARPASPPPRARRTR
jgi:AcrR family transcriptional regulator